MINWHSVAIVSGKFAKKHWKELLLVSLIMTMFFKFQSDYASLEKAYTITESSLKEQIETMNPK